MKPYKIIRPVSNLNWQGYYQWQVEITAPLPKPKIPLRYFSKVRPNPEERLRWLGTFTVINEKEQAGGADVRGGGP